MANPGDQRGQDGGQHGGDEGRQNLDPGLAAYAHSADQSMGYLETEQQGQTEDYGDEPYGAYEAGGAMNADSDRYSPDHTADQSRLPDVTGQPGAGPWATESPGSEPLGAGEQAMSAEYAAWHPPAVSDPGMSANPGQPTADELRVRELEQTLEMRHLPPNPNDHPGAPLGLVPGTGQNAGGAGEAEDGSAGQSREAGGSRRVTGVGQPEVASRRAPLTGETAEQGQARPSRIETTPPGGKTVAEQVLRRDTHEMERQERLQAGARGTSSGRAQPAGTVRPTDKHAEALLDARTRIHDAIDQLASQIPYGEELAQPAKEAADTALDRMEAQSLRREAELRRDPSATP